MKYVMTFCFITVFVLGWVSPAYTWENRSTHPELTMKAIYNNSKSMLDDYLKEQLGIEQGYDCELLLDQSNIPVNNRIPHNQFESRILGAGIMCSNEDGAPMMCPRNIMHLLVIGSLLEDVPSPRARHHFHDPTRNTGLDNKTDHPNRADILNTATYIWNLGEYIFDFTGASNLERAKGTDYGFQTEYINYFSWPDSRSYFYKALTAEDDCVREHYLSLTFLALGHALHLLEDMSVPAHVRNDFIEGHFRGAHDFGNPLEAWVEKEIHPGAWTWGQSHLGIPDEWLEGWTPQAMVFDKLADYWDTGLYDAEHQAYISPSDPTLNDWGLSERSNYQFLSYSTVFTENDDQTKYGFPHPAFTNTTEYIDTDKYLWGSVTVSYKYRSGYDITHLSRTKFLDKNMAEVGGDFEEVQVTRDDAVFEDYAKITIPRTIDYVTGLVNYFFRGRLEIGRSVINGDQIEITIRNTSYHTDPAAKAYALMQTYITPM